LRNVFERRSGGLLTSVCRLLPWHPCHDGREAFHPQMPHGFGMPTASRFTPAPSPPCARNTSPRADTVDTPPPNSCNAASVFLPFRPCRSPPHAVTLDHVRLVGLSRMLVVGPAAFTFHSPLLSITGPQW